LGPFTSYEENEVWSIRDQVLNLTL
jgi:hypothetical protein